ncbi:MAG: hypothetical protein Q4B44_00300 [Erysipelotrichaceae bacterium]|nr:hypothetical protein [Erysipelotrichaceae bacterium]
MRRLRQVCGGLPGRRRQARPEAVQGGRLQGGLSDDRTA